VPPAAGFLVGVHVGAGAWLCGLGGAGAALTCGLGGAGEALSCGLGGAGVAGAGVAGANVAGAGVAEACHVPPSTGALEGFHVGAGAAVIHSGVSDEVLLGLESLESSSFLPLNVPAVDAKWFMKPSVTAASGVSSAGASLALAGAGVAGAGVAGADVAGVNGAGVDVAGVNVSRLSERIAWPGTYAGAGVAGAGVAGAGVAEACHVPPSTGALEGFHVGAGAAVIHSGVSDEVLLGLESLESSSFLPLNVPAVDAKWFMKPSVTAVSGVSSAWATLASSAVPDLPVLSGASSAWPGGLA